MSPNGCTSIRADLQNGRKTEVDTISGSVVRAAKNAAFRYQPMSSWWKWYTLWKTKAGNRI
ncbi:ketopantoate reductase C-terminal domain-containing protein [Pelosinus fermentans]|uniref:ketopantoate reductase C-terminal domain-containing protein n=1 Tax=Pelosinus fermentans TaxID=365349 RepID=UPI003B43B68F